MSKPTASFSPLLSGNGRIVVKSHANRAVFSELVSTYPLKLLSPRILADGTAVVYVLSYGGGLIGGDEVVLTVHVQDQARLVLLSQGSTKVFKMRAGKRLASSVKMMEQPAANGDPIYTTQLMEYTVGEGCGLYLLPEPVTCFRDATYKQIQRFHLVGPQSSLVVLDSITSGRQAMGEDWDFTEYYSLNEVRVDGKLVAKDISFLQDQGLPSMPISAADHSKVVGVPYRPLRDQLAPYSCYAMVLLYGAQVQEVVEDIEAQYKKITVYQERKPADSLWSFSLLGSSVKDGAIVRVAGKETEIVRSCLKTILRPLDVIIGIDTFRRAFA